MSQPGSVSCPQCDAATTRQDTLLSCVPTTHLGLGFFIRECPACGCKFDFDAGNDGVACHKEIMQYPQTLARYIEPSPSR